MGCNPQDYGVMDLPVPRHSSHKYREEEERKNVPGKFARPGHGKSGRETIHAPMDLSRTNPDRKERKPFCPAGCPNREEGSTAPSETKPLVNHCYPYGKQGGFHMKRFGIVTALALVLAGMAFVADASTIKPGEVRIATGKVSAIDSASNALVMESPTSKGMMTVGVTMKKGASIMEKSRAISLGDLKVGKTVALRYTRENGRLIGMSVRAL
jgi:hypothetical protein